MKKKSFTIKVKQPKIRNLDLMNAWQSGMMRTKVIPNKKKKMKKFNWKQAIADYLNIKQLQQVSA